MEHFLILIFEEEWDSEAVTEADWEKAAKEHSDFIDAVRSAGGELVHGDAVAGNARALRLRPGVQGAQAAVTQGPFTESKEVLSGYYAITATGLEEAKQLAALCPTAGYVELHPILDLSHLS